MLRHATGRSLLLLDEFGKGTNVTDGVSVLTGVLRHLLTRDECPKVLVTTHFSEYLFDQSLLPETPSLSSVHMETHVTETHDATARDVVFLYRYALSHARVLQR